MTKQLSDLDPNVLDKLALALDDETLSFNSILQAIADKVGGDPDVYDLLCLLQEQQGTLASSANSALVKVQEYIEMAKAFVQTAVAERDGAINELAKLEEAVENADLDHPLVGELYQSAFDEGYERGEEQSDVAVWGEQHEDFNEGFEKGEEHTIERIKEALATILDCDEDEVEELAEGLTDYRAIINSEKALAQLKLLAAKASGEEF